jgi:CheY-like chemotaxis protein
VNQVNLNWHVLVVEDTEDDIQVISQLLEHHDFQISVAHNGVECLQMLESFQPDLVIMDLTMPQMDGWSTLVAMRCNPSTAHIPVVATTAYHSPEIAHQAIEDGFDAYFPKPVTATFIQEITSVVVSQ